MRSCFTFVGGGLHSLNILRTSNWNVWISINTRPSLPPSGRRLNSIGEQVFVMFRPNEPGITVFFQKQRIHVFGGAVECESRWVFHFFVRAFHRFPVYIDLARSAGCQKLAENHTTLNNLCTARVLFSFIRNIDYYSPECNNNEGFRFFARQCNNNAFPSPPQNTHLYISLTLYRICD